MRTVDKTRLIVGNVVLQKASQGFPAFGEGPVMSSRT